MLKRPLPDGAGVIIGAAAGAVVWGLLFAVYLLA